MHGFLLLLALTQSPLWGDLTPGPHRVGFKVVTMRDATRSFGAPANAPASARGFAMVIQYWYPAAAGGAGTRMTFGDYQASGAFDAQLVAPSRTQLAANDTALKAFYERAQNFPFGPVEPERWARLAPTPLLAVANATPVAGRFPIVVGVGGAGGNQVLGEYLASHGYVVALAGSRGAPATTQAGGMEWNVRDLEFALAHLRTLPFADANKVATWGFSFAGMPALLAAMRSPDIDAVVSLESGIFSAQFSGGLTANPFYDVAGLRVPFLHMMRAQLSRDTEDLTGLDALRYSARLRYLLNDTTLVHQDFGTHGMAAAAVLGKRPAALLAARQALVTNAEYVRHFLDAHVKELPDARSWLLRTPEQNGIPAGFLTLDRKEARTPAPNAAEFVTLIRSQGARAALVRFHEARRQDPDATIFQEATINAMGYQLLQEARGADALEIFKLNTELYPRSANTWDSLSEAYEAAGNAAEAVATSRKVLEVLPGDTAPQATRDNLQRIANERIRRLGGGTH